MKFLKTRLSNPAIQRPPSRQFQSPVQAVLISNDSLVYICDRANSRIVVTHKETGRRDISTKNIMDKAQNDNLWNCPS